MDLTVSYLQLFLLCKFSYWARCYSVPSQFCCHSIGPLKDKILELLVQYFKIVLYTSSIIITCVLSSFMISSLSVTISTTSLTQPSPRVTRSYTMMSSMLSLMIHSTHLDPLDAVVRIPLYITLINLDCTQVL